MKTDWTHRTAPLKKKRKKESETSGRVGVVCVDVFGNSFSSAQLGIQLFLFLQ